MTSPLFFFLLTLYPENFNINFYFQFLPFAGKGANFDEMSKFFLFNSVSYWPVEMVSPLQLL